MGSHVAERGGGRKNHKIVSSRCLAKGNSISGLLGEGMGTPPPPLSAVELRLAPPTGRVGKLLRRPKECSPRSCASKSQPLTVSCWDPTCAPSPPSPHELLLHPTGQSGRIAAYVAAVGAAGSLIATVPHRRGRSSHDWSRALALPPPLPCVLPLRLNPCRAPAGPVTPCTGVQAFGCMAI